MGRLSFSKKRFKTKRNKWATIKSKRWVGGAFEKEVEKFSENISQGPSQATATTPLAATHLTPSLPIQSIKKGTDMGKYTAIPNEQNPTIITVNGKDLQVLQTKKENGYTQFSVSLN